MKTANNMCARLVLGIFLLLNFASAWSNGIEGPKSFVETAGGELQYLLTYDPPSDAKAVARIEKAIKHINRALNPDYWNEGGPFISELTKKGKKAFVDMRKAAAELEKIDGYPMGVEYALTDLFRAACDLAENAIGLGTLTEDIIDDILMDEETMDLHDKSIEKALGEFRDALQDHEVFDINGSIKHFSKAWKHAN